MGKVSKGVKCSVIGCEKEATRSLPINKVTKTGLKNTKKQRKKKKCWTNGDTKAEYPKTKQPP